MKSTEQAALEAPVLLVTVIAMEMNMTVATAMDMEKVADGVGRNMRIVLMIGHLVVLEEGTEIFNVFSLPINYYQYYFCFQNETVSFIHTLVQIVSSKINAMF